MIQNEIISDIRQIREEYPQRFNFNLKAMCADLRVRPGKSGHVLVRFPPKRVKAVLPQPLSKVA